MIETDTLHSYDVSPIRETSSKLSFIYFSFFGSSLLSFISMLLSTVFLVMETFIYLFHATEVRTMAFTGHIRPERWNKLLNPVDDMSRVAISRSLGEGVFSYDFA
jgi:hypothetical protein